VLPVETPALIVGKRSLRSDIGNSRRKVAVVRQSRLERRQRGKNDPFSR